MPSRNNPVCACRPIPDLAYEAIILRIRDDRGVFHHPAWHDKCHHNVARHGTGGRYLAPMDALTRESAGLETTVDRSTAPAPDRGGTALFLRRWLAHPLQMGSVVPSSPALCRRLVRAAWPQEGETVLELGAGTGVIGRALLDAGLPPERLIAVEIVPAMAAHLRRSLAGVRVIEADARDLPALLAAEGSPPLGALICGIPLVLLPKAAQARFIDTMRALAPALMRRRGFLHYSYCATSPLPMRAHRLAGRREFWTPLNFPPASVWRYRDVA